MLGSKVRLMRVPVFTPTMQFGIVVRDLDATMRENAKSTGSLRGRSTNLKGRICANGRNFVSRVTHGQTRAGSSVYPKRPFS